MHCAKAAMEGGAYASLRCYSTASTVSSVECSSAGLTGLLRILVSTSQLIANRSASGSAGPACRVGWLSGSDCQRGVDLSRVACKYKSCSRGGGLSLAADATRSRAWMPQGAAARSRHRVQSRTNLLVSSGLRGRWSWSRCAVMASAESGASSADTIPPCRSKRIHIERFRGTRRKRT
jgi:hypothetical protein